MKRLASVLVLGLGLGFSFGLGPAACGAGTGGQPATSPGPGAEPPASGCAREISIRCMNGVDGCEGGKTTEHVCVPADAKTGPACELELALVCPEGQVDGCLRSPPVSRNHVCVYN